MKPFVIFLAILLFPLWGTPQNYDIYLEATRKHINAKDFDNAKKTYNVYVKMTQRKDSSIEAILYGVDDKSADSGKKVLKQGAQMTFLKTSHDLGDIPRWGHNVTCSFEFVNDGDKPLAIQKITTSCTALHVRKYKNVILAGETSAIEIIVNAHKLFDVYSTRPFTTSVIINTNSTDTRKVLTIKGQSSNKLSRQNVAILYSSGAKYVGEKVGGEPHGQGTLYYANGEKKYEGNWENGSRSGQGTMYYANGDRYEGNWENDKLSGQGTYFWSDGVKYEGNWENGIRSGQGTVYYANGDRYEGSWENDNRSGQGTYFWSNGARYEGSWKNDSRSGQGTMYYANGEKEYEGTWENDKLSGQGTMYFANGARYEGNWENGKRSGQGTMFYSFGAKYEGEWTNDEFNGNGTIYYKTGLRFIGLFESGKSSKQGAIYYPNGDIYNGSCTEAGITRFPKKNGLGTMHYSNGKSKYGIWMNDKLKKRLKRK